MKFWEERYACMVHFDTTHSSGTISPISFSQVIAARRGANGGATKRRRSRQVCLLARLFRTGETHRLWKSVDCKVSKEAGKGCYLACVQAIRRHRKRRRHRESDGGTSIVHTATSDHDSRLLRPVLNFHELQVLSDFWRSRPSISMLSALTVLEYLLIHVKCKIRLWNDNPF